MPGRKSINKAQWRIQKVAEGGAKDRGSGGLTPRENFLKSGRCRCIVRSFSMYSKTDELNNNYYCTKTTAVNKIPMKVLQLYTCRYQFH